MKKLYVDEIEMDAITDAVDAILDDMDTSAFDEHITDEYGYYTYIEACDGEWQTIELLERLGVYDDMLDGWKEEQRGRIEREIEEMEVGDRKEIYGCEVEVKDEFDEMLNGAKADLDAIAKALDALRPIYGGSVKANIEGLASFIDAVASVLTREAE